MASNHKIQQVPFNGTPEMYGIWVYRVTALFKAKGWADRLVTPTTVTSTTDDTEAKQGTPTSVVDQAAEDCALASLALSLPDSLAGLFLDHKTTASLWSAITAHFQSSSMSNKSHLRTKLSTMRMDSATDYLRYWAEINTIVRTLGSMGESVPDSEVMHTVLHGLHPELKQARTHFQLTPPTSLAAMHQLLKDFQERLVLEGASSSESSHAAENYYHGSTNSNRHQSGGQRFHQSNSNGSSCFTCNESGHVAFECKKNASKMKCTFCRAIGSHVEADCRKKKASTQGQGRHSSNQSQRPSSNHRAASSSNKNSSTQSAHYNHHEESDSDQDSFYFGPADAAVESPPANTICVPSAKPATTVDLSPYNYTLVFKSARVDPVAIVAAAPAPIKMTLDCASSIHVCNTKAHFDGTLKTVDPIRCLVANNEVVVLDQAGSLRLAIGNKFMTLDNVYYAPKCPVNLLSVGEKTAANERLQIVFDSEGALIQKKSKLAMKKYAPGCEPKDIPPPVTLTTVPRSARGNLFVMEALVHTGATIGHTAFSLAADVADAAPSSSTATNFYRLSHERLGHPGRSKVEQLFKSDTVTGLEPLAGFDFKSKRDALCHGCESGKTTRASFSKLSADKPAAQILDRLHADIKGPIGTPTHDGHRYVLTLTDEKSRRTWVVLLTKKSDAADAIIELCRLTRTATGKTLREFHSDNGTEFVNKELKSFFAQQGTRFTTTTPGTPQHNGIAERVNRTLFNSARSMMYHAGAPAHLWGYAVLTAAHLKNKSLTRVNGSLTPETVWRQQAHDLDHATRSVPSTDPSHFRTSLKNLRVFGCNVYIHKPDASATDARSTKGIFLGYDDVQKRYYRVLDLASRKVVIRRDVHFDEGKFTSMREYTPEKYRPFDADLADSTQEASARSAALTPATPTAPSVDRPAAAPSSADASDSGSDPDSESDSDDAADPPAVNQPAPMAASAGSSIPIAPHVPRARFVAAGQVVHAAAFVPPPPQKKAKTVFDGVSRDNILVGSRRSTQPSSDHRALALTESPSGATESVVTEYIDADPNVIPTTYNQAMAGANSLRWQEAVQRENDSMIMHRVFDLVVLPRGANLISCRWVFAKKLNANGLVKRFKARLVAKGYKQIADVDYYETFAAVMRYKSLKILLAIAARLDFEVRHLDVPTAFLNADLKEDVYVEQPQGFHTGDRHMVWKLRKSLYGIKQAPNNWNGDLNHFLLSLGFSRCRTDTCIYVKRSATGRMLAVGVFVDDLIPVYSGRDQAEWTDIHLALKEKYQINDTGEAELVLGMRVTRDRPNRTIKLDQATYIGKMLTEFQLAECNPSATPCSSYTLSAADCPSTAEGGDHHDATDRHRYQSMVGSLNYASISTRPDITYAVNVLSRYLHNPGQNHMTACKRVFRYLKGTATIGIVLGGTSDAANPIGALDLLAYSDSDWAGDRDGRRSTTGFIILIGGSIVSWQSKRQSVVSMSSCEAEYYAVSAALAEVKWIRQFLGELFQYDQTLSSIPIDAVGLVDNQSAITISSNDVHHNRTKHIDIRHHFIREAIQAGQYRLEYVPTVEQLADILTKGLGQIVHERLRNQVMA